MLEPRTKLEIQVGGMTNSQSLNSTTKAKFIENWFREFNYVVMSKSDVEFYTNNPEKAENLDYTIRVRLEQMLTQYYIFQQQIQNTNFRN